MAKNELAPKGSNPVAVIRNYLTDEKLGIKKRLEDILGDQAGAYGNAIVNVVRNSDQLQKCDPDSIMTAAFRGATFGMSVDPALGQAALVPYGKKCEFQFMYKGVIQLCLRSGQYATIHCTEVYKDELKSWNPISGKAEFNDPIACKLRDKAKESDVVGHYVRFKLVTGFEKEDFMTHEQVLSHAKRYSAAYKYDLKINKKLSPWSLYPVAMGNKTVLLRLLKMYGIMSIEMQSAFDTSHETFESQQESAETTIKDQAGSEAVEVEFIPKSDDSEASQQNNTPDDAVSEPEPVEGVKLKWKCINNHEFAEPMRAGKNLDILQCPSCFTKDIKEQE